MSTKQDKSLMMHVRKGIFAKYEKSFKRTRISPTGWINVIGFLGYTPLHEAACQCHDDILQLLLIYVGCDGHATMGFIHHWHSILLRPWIM
ncbi:Hypothetical predicted protein [Paramuricea clavata]|uniref:Uncharacterized protein n=1 Tax=Paramuricea clavata TaxID=317549 RepID=A0A6S7HHW8_PARCT|nr:Hypothetical predicted protein [Paramuricea clavata]